MSDEPEAIADPLAKFRENNPEASIEATQTSLRINRPWNDPSIALEVDLNNPAFVAAITELRLPPRFSAIWHKDTRDLEFIYTFLRKDSPIRSRKFTFLFDGNEYQCEFGESGDRLRLVAEAVRILDQPTSTNYRNLIFFRLMSRQADSTHAATSFWIRSLAASEEEAVEIAQNLNFYMQYFDRSTPIILVHALEGEPGEVAESPSPGLFEDFPSAIHGTRRDSYQLGLWENSATALEAWRRFLSSYQVIEYAAFYHIRDEIVRAIKKKLRNPDFSGQIDTISREIIELLTEDRSSDEAKLTTVIQQLVDPARLWPMVQEKKAFFSREVIFDGGFTVAPLIKEEWELDDFRTAWIPKLPDTLRKLRNALVHAREQRAAISIAPTKRNERLLRPWASLIQVAAAEVILYT